MRKVSASTRPFSVRMSNDLITEMQEIAAQCGYSSNQFAEYCIEGILEMIKAPEGKVTMPKVVAISRFMRSNNPQPVSTRKV